MAPHHKLPIPTEIIVKYLKEHPQAKDLSNAQMKKLELYAAEHLPKYIVNVKDIEPQLIALVDIAFVNKPLGWLFKPFAMPHVKAEINKIIAKYREAHKHDRGFDDTDNLNAKRLAPKLKPTKTTDSHRFKRRPNVIKHEEKERKHAIKQSNKAIKRCRKSKIQVRIIRDPK